MIIERDTHCIPNDEELYQMDNLLAFLDQHEVLIRDRITSTFEVFSDGKV